MATTQKPYSNAAPVTPGTKVAPGVGVLVSCTVAGNQSLLMRDGQAVIIPVAVGITLLDDFAVIDAPTSGTTATATVYVLSRS